ncbi:Glycerophosphodiester phosphodiesterase 1 [Gracilariopsis chorda]|uniref:Glycerophosphodiester phosphodiesterase 1 n=1 Tax=Gracilariopsis chorda TaxID=448386 RepID=A0A2V3IQ30_9FLOR|nr:Glycerophosphodiester phosphodiesterase 1 [Gracilariopsis chorda]|eukprot:PXF44178.1 Glycerophosphodiester phosphodiesterase 1 [Gracilariopsis chorda]
MRRATQPDQSVTTPIFSVADEDEEELLPQRTPPPPPPSHKSFFRNSSENRSSAFRFLRRINRFLFFAFPRVLVILVLVVVTVAMLPGGWRVALCASNLLPPPTLRPGENITFIGHRGCEFPYPENSLHALRVGAKEAGFVELDVALTSDGTVVLMHDQTLDRTTNGTGTTCTRSTQYVKQLELQMPTRDPLGRMAQGKFCSFPSPRGTTTPCTYRVPTLEQIFDDLPHHTRFMIDVKECYADGLPDTVPKCSNCSLLMQTTRDLMEKYAISPERVIFTSKLPASLRVFQDGIPRSKYAISMDQGYSHYKRSSFRELMTKGAYDYAAMHYGLAAVRPDFVQIMRTERTKGVGQMGDVFAWTIRKDLDYRLARCAGISKMIVAEPHRVKNRFTLNVAEWFGESLVTAS